MKNVVGLNQWLIFSDSNFTIKVIPALAISPKTIRKPEVYWGTLAWPELISNDLDFTELFYKSKNYHAQTSWKQLPIM